MSEIPSIEDQHPEMKKPSRDPEEMNGEHRQLWELAWYNSHRIDGLYRLIIGFGTGILVALGVGWLSLMAQL